VASVGAIAGAGLISVATFVILRVTRIGRSWSACVIVFWCGLIIFGGIATPLINRHSNQFTFTWPLVLVVVQQLALVAVMRPKQLPRSKTGDWIGVAGAAFLILTCLVYFKITRQLNLAPAWYFLVALPAAWPIGLPTARRHFRPGKLSADIVWTVATFSMYFWACGGAMLLRTIYFYQSGAPKL
jgi:hypothetical protein